MGEVIGTEMGMEVRRKMGRLPGIEMGMKLGRKMGMVPGIGIGIEAGRNMGKVPGTETGCIVPHSKSGIVPRSSLLGAGQLGFWEVGKGGTIG
jgi:hypothetical protein